LLLLRTPSLEKPYIILSVQFRERAAMLAKLLTDNWLTSFSTLPNDFLALAWKVLTKLGG